jgi:serine/threonine-protein kinase
MMAAFRHPGVVEVYDYASAGDSADEDQCAYLVMAYVEGEPLSTRLKEAGRLSVAETMSIVSQAGDALHAAHLNGTVHRDVKPGNLIVKPTGAVILVDFGVARSAAVTSVTGLNAIVGTALYMAPEQVAKGNVTPATDIYALGAVAYHCIAGHPPFDGDNALQVALRHLDEEPEPLPDDVPLAVRELISRAMAKHPEDRFASAAEFADAALAAVAGDAPTTVTPGQTGTGLTRTVLAAPAAGATAAAAPLRTAPVPRHQAPPPPVSPQRRRSRAQLAVLLTVIALILTAAGLALALVMSDRNPDDAVVNPGTTNSAEPTESTEPELPLVPLPSDEETRSTSRPNGQTSRPSRSATPSTSATRTTPATTTPTPTTTTTTPSTEPTTTTPTPTETTTEPENPEGGGAGTED